MEFTAAGQSIRITVPGWSALHARVGARLASGQGFAMATLNLDHLVKLNESEVFRQAYAAHELVTADGHPIVWMSWLAGRPVRLLPGSDALVPLVRLAAAHDAPIAMVGSTEYSLTVARTRLERMVPGAHVATCISPCMDFDPTGPEARAILSRIEASGVRLCFIALGAPKQEIFAAFGRTVAPSVGFVSVGAGLDFIAGTQTRAPYWVRSGGLEWLWRALGNPRRLAYRYLRCIGILPSLAGRALRMRLRAGGA